MPRKAAAKKSTSNNVKPPAAPPAIAPAPPKSTSGKANQKESTAQKRKKLNNSPTLFSSDDEDSNWVGEIPAVGYKTKGPENGAQLNPYDMNVDNTPQDKPKVAHMANKETEFRNINMQTGVPVPGPSHRVHVPQGVVHSEADIPELDLARLSQLEETAKETRKRIVLLVTRIFDQEVISSLSVQSSSAGVPSLPISLIYIQRFVDFLRMSIRTTPFIHCNIKARKFVNDPERVAEFNGLIYPAVGALVLIKDTEPLHETISTTIQRLLSHLLKHDFEVFERAIFSLLKLVDGLKGSCFKFVYNISSATSEGVSSTIKIQIPEINANGLANLLKILYPFWAMNKLSGSEFQFRFFEALLKTWRCSKHAVRCESLEGFPCRLMLRDAQCQIYLCEIVEEVLKHILMYGILPQALHFLNQVWEHEIIANANTEITFLQLAISKVLLDTIFGELLNTAMQNHAKELVLGLLDQLRTTHPFFEGVILARLHSESIEQTFIKNPLSLSLLDNTIFQECTVRSESSNESEVLEFTKVSETWNTLVKLWTKSCTGTDFSSFEAFSQRGDGLCLNIAMQTYVLAKLAYSVFGKLTSKSSCVIWTLDFMQNWRNVLGKSLQLTSQTAMNEVMSISIETLHLISGCCSASFRNMNMKGIRETFVFFFSSRWFSFPEFPNIKLDIFLNHQKWRRISLDETDVLQKCVHVLALPFFDPCEDLVIRLISHAMKRYTTCLGIVLGLLDLIAEFTKLSRKLDMNLIHGFLITCAKRFEVTWSGNEELEISLAKAYSRLICLITNRETQADSCFCQTSKVLPCQQSSPLQNETDADLMKFTAPFFKSTSLLVKLELTELLTRFKMHSFTPKKEVVNYFLPFMSENSQVLREKVASSLHMYLQTDEPLLESWRPKLIDLIFQKVRLHLLSVKGEDYARENVAITGVLQQLSRGADTYIQSRIIKLLIELTIKAKSHRLPALYARVIQTVANEAWMEPSHLMGRHRELISREIVESFFRIILPESSKIITSQSEWNFIPPVEPMENALIRMISSAFNRLIFLGDYVRKSLFMEHFVPLIMLRILSGIRDNRNKQLLLYGLADFAGLSGSELLVEYFPRYYPLIVLHPMGEIRDSMLEFVRGFEVGASSIAKCCYQTLSNELLSRMSVNEAEVFRAFSLVLQWVNTCNTAKNHERGEILKYISTRLLGFYVYIQNQLSDSCSCLERKKQVLESFIVLLSHLKSEHLQATKFKLYMVLSSLTCAEAELQECLVRAWYMFASRVDSSELPDMIVQIMAATKLQANCMEGRLLSFLFDLNRKSFKLAVPELYFVKDSLLANVKDLECLSYFPNGKILLELLVKQLGHYNRHIRIHALTKLRDTLQQRDRNEGFDIQEMISERSEMIPEGWHLIMELMRNFCGKNDKMNSLATECVGLVGAIDPYRIPAHHTQKRAGNARPILNTLSSAFLTEFLERLGSLVQSAFKDSDFDIYAFTIQEVLRIAMIKAEPRNTTWNSLSHKAKAVIEPMFASKYSLRREPEPICSYPIFGSSRGNKFHDWVYHFIFKMTSLLEPSASGQFLSVHNLFDLSKLITTRCPDFACFILPHVVLHAALAADEPELLSIIQELNLVTNQWVPAPGLMMNERHMESRMDSICLDLNTSVIETETKKCLDASENLRFANAIFNVIDHISEVATSLNPLRDVPHVTCEGLVKLKRVTIPKSTLSRAAFGTGSFHRALKYYEQSIIDENEPLQDTLSYLQRIFVALDDTDSIAGVIAVTATSLSQYENIIANLSFGRKEEAASAFERWFNNEPEDAVARQCLVQAYLSLDQPHLAHDILDTYFRVGQIETQETDDNSSSREKKRHDALLHECRLEACWRLEQWEELKVITNSTVDTMPNSWSRTIAQALLSLKNNEYDRLTETVAVAREQLVAPLAGMVNDWDSYVGKYGDIVRLQILSEVQQAGEFLQITSAPTLVSIPVNRTDKIVNQKLEFLLLNWKRKLSIIQNAISVVDPVFSVRKTVLRIIQEKFQDKPNITNMIDLEIMSYLLKIAKLESKDQNYGRAYNCIVQASKISPMVFVHEAKLLVKKGDHAQGLEIINKGLDNNPLVRKEKDQQNGSDPFNLQEKLHSKALLMFAQLNDKLRNVDVQKNISNYNRVCDMYATEKSFVNLACYLDRVLEDFQDRVKKPLETQKWVLECYAKSLKYGCKHVFQSLPRLLSIWFDNASDIPPKKCGLSPPDLPAAHNGRKAMKPPEEPDNPLYTNHMKALKAMTEHIEELVNSVPMYILLTAFPQLVSRLYHPEEVWPVLKKILVKIVTKYPGKALWMLTSVRKSSFRRRSQKCMEIIKAVCSSCPNLVNLTTDYAALAEQLIILSNKAVIDSGFKTSMRTFMPSLETLIKKKDFCNVLIPLEHFMTVTLPQANSNLHTHIPYPEEEVYITGVEDRVDIMASLQKPKKIVLRGSNGKLYGMMCKANDDLRKDSKVMEFNNVVNWYLSRTSESSQRNLRIRTYGVTPLNETCGLVEWVDNLMGFRTILSSCFKEVGANEELRIIREGGKRLKVRDPFETKLKWFEDSISRAPGVMAYWFFRKYKNPQDWYKARLNYARTYAVMSIVGYIMGLGDRHGENILLDTRTGDVVHVDFNCIFNKGDTMDWVERVPFRLTKNVIDGFGPLGCEGTFRKICELTLKILRDNIEVFLSTMQPFVFDPLVEWSYTKIDACTNEGDSQLRNNDEALKHLNEIRLRLLGGKRNMTKQLNVEFSVEAQVNYLIQEASSSVNLCQMYPGWAAYL